jgi:hypothetical protein
LETGLTGTTQGLDSHTCINGCQLENLHMIQSMAWSRMTCGRDVLQLGFEGLVGTGGKDIARQSITLTAAPTFGAAHTHHALIIFPVISAIDSPSTSSHHHSLQHPEASSVHSNQRDLLAGMSIPYSTMCVQINLRILARKSN